MKTNHKTELDKIPFFLLLPVFLILCGALTLPFWHMARAAGASLFFSPQSGSFKVGDTFKVKAMLNSGGAPGVNASDGTITYDKSLLSVTGVTKDGSIFNLWTSEPAYSNAAGTITFSGGSPAPYSGASGTVVTITFKALKEGTAAVAFTSAQALAADGKGTNILSGMGQASYTIAAKAAVPKPTPEQSAPTGPVPDEPVIKSSTHQEESHWYANNAPVFIWDIPSGVSTVRILFNKIEQSQPSVLYAPPISEKKLENVEDGIWYFHAQFKNENGWGKVAHRKVMVDTKPPLSFDVSVKQKEPTDNYPLLMFFAEDELSGVVYYEVKIGDGEWFQVSVETVRSNPYRMPFQDSGEHPVVVRAVDAAGNSVEANTNVKVAAKEQPPVYETPPSAEGPSSFDVKISTWLGILIGLLLLTSIFLLDRLLREKRRDAKREEKIRRKLLETIKKMEEIFNTLEEEVEEQIKMADKKSRQSKSEKEISDKIKEAMNISEELIKRELEELQKNL